MTNGNQVLTSDQPDPNVVSTSSIPETSDTARDQGWATIAIGALIGATLGGLAGALANKRVVNGINQVIKDAGSSLKKTTSNVNVAVQDAGDAVFTITTNVTDTVKDLGESVKQTADSVNSTVRETIDTVRSTAIDVNGTVRTTLDSVKDTTEELIQPNESTPAKPEVEIEPDTLYKLIPVESSE